MSLPHSAALAGGGMLALQGLQRGGALGNLMTIGGGASAGFGLAPLMGMTGYGGAITGAGAGLAMAGLQRGGLSGLGMSTAGAAIVGMQFGGPLGAAIGAGVGFVGGLVRLFVKGARQKAKEAIRTVHGVDIADNGVLDQIVQMAKQSFGGDIQTAIRAPQVREIIELYAMSRGQAYRGPESFIQGVSLSQANGSLYQMPTYYGGTPLSSGGSVPVSQSNAGPVVVQTLQLSVNGQAANDALEGRVAKVVTPKYVVTAATSAAKSNVGRRQSAVMGLTPGTLLAKADFRCGLRTASGWSVMPWAKRPHLTCGWCR